MRQIVEDDGTEREEADSYGRPASRLRKFFEIDKYGSTLGREFLAGTTTFVALAYIFAVNPQILSDAGFPFEAVLFATVFCSAITCTLMGLWANKPFALAPGMGMNGYVAYYVCKTLGVSWQSALGIVFISGILNIALSVSPIRDRIIDSIPVPLKNGIAVGVGIFIALIGLRTANILAYEGVRLKGIGDITPLQIGLVVAGVVIMWLLKRLGVEGSILFGMLGLTAIGLVFGLTAFPKSLVALPRGAFDGFLALNFRGLLDPRLWGVLVALFLVDFFSSVGTFIGVALNTNLLDSEGRMPGMKEALIADSCGTPIGALFGTTSITTYIETAAGVQAGGRTGLTALVVAAWMLPMLFFAPLARIIPNFATAPALIFVGILMMVPITTVREYDIAEKVGFIALVIGTSLTFAIDQGMLYGFAGYIVMKWLTGKRAEISGFLYLTTAILVVGKIVAVFFVDAA